MSKLILGLVGMPGAGKGTAATYIQEKYGASLYRFSSILSDILKRLALPSSRDNLQKLSLLVRENFGEDILSHALEQDALDDPAPLVVIDGVRRIQDLAALEPLPQFKLVAIDVPAKVRFDRLKNRGEKAGEKDMTWDQFQTQETANADATIPEVMQRAAVKLDNSSDLAALQAKLDALMAENGISPL